MPITVPRFVSNQRLTIVAPATRLMLPAPTPTMPPHSSKNCHDWVMKIDAAAARAIRPSAPEIVRRKPKRSNTPAANGPMSPNRSRLSAIAAEIVAVVQWNSRWRGSISIVGDERTPAAAISNTKASAATM